MHKNKIDLTFVPWRRDRITRHYVERNGATLEELTVRAGTSRKFAEAEPDEKYAILVQAAQKFGIQLF